MQFTLKQTPRDFSTYFRAVNFFEAFDTLSTNRIEKQFSFLA